jgi:hypothetical protein
LNTPRETSPLPDHVRSTVTSVVAPFASVTGTVATRCAVYSLVSISKNAGAEPYAEKRVMPVH